MPAPQVKKPQSAGRKSDVIVGDEVYFQHKDGPMTGKVRAHGEHGCHIHSGGKLHKVEWSKLLGHKRRAHQDYKVVDEGEDGMIVQDKRGLRQFIAVPPEAREEQMVIKAHMGARPRLALLLKAEKPQEKGWTSSEGQDKPKAGAHVGWVNGEHRGHGKVAAAGKDGVTAKDGAGGLHKIRHEHITHHWKGDGEPDRSPHDADAEAREAEQKANCKKV